MTDNMERALQERLLARSQVSPRDVEALRLFARTLPARRSFWQRPAFAWAGTAAAVALTAVLGMRLFAAVPGPGATPSGTPVPTSKPIVTPAPTSKPFSRPVVGTPIELVVADPGRILVDGGAARQDDMQIRWFESTVAQLAPNAIRVRWTAYADQGPARVTATESNGKVTLTITQKAPPAQSDAEGLDRVMVLYFAHDIDATDIVVEFAAS